MRAPLAAAATLAALLATAPARADRAVPHPPYPSWFVPEGRGLESFALELNPLALLLGIYSANLEYVGAPHHGFVVSPSYTYTNPGKDDEITGFGGEAAYRYYSGTHGPEGWFIGGGGTIAELRYIHRVSIDHPSFSPAVDTSYTSYGLFADAGYQLLLHEHLVLGVGAGIAYRFFSDQPQFETESHAHTDLLYGSGLRPRFLAVFGGAL